MLVNLIGRTGLRHSGEGRCPAALLNGDGDGATVLCPSLFVRAKRNRTLFAVTDGGDARRINAERGEIVFRGIGAALTQRQIVLAGAALVCVPFDRHTGCRVGGEPLGLTAQGGLVLGVDVIFVSVEINAI